MRLNNQDIEKLKRILDVDKLFYVECGIWVGDNKHEKYFIIDNEIYKASEYVRIEVCSLKEMKVSVYNSESIIIMAYLYLNIAKVLAKYLNTDIKMIEELSRRMVYNKYRPLLYTVPKNYIRRDGIKISDGGKAVLKLKELEVGSVYLAAGQSQEIYLYAGKVKGSYDKYLTDKKEGHLYIYLTRLWCEKELSAQSTIENARLMLNFSLGDRQSLVKGNKAMIGKIEGAEIDKDTLRNLLLAHRYEILDPRLSN